MTKTVLGPATAAEATAYAAPKTAVSRQRGWITDWDPENPEFWERTGRRIATRNLVFSILSEHLGFSVWLLWSAIVVSLPAAGFDFTVNQLFWLTALPNLIGGVIRIPYTTAVAAVGGRNWTVVSTMLLFLPLAMLAICVTNPDTPYWMFLLAAATAGVGGGNFASSMANISFFYPERRKGFVLGLNAAGGNVGVAVVQLLVPAVVGIGIIGAAQGPDLYLQNAALCYALFVTIAAVCAWRFMDNLAVVRTPMRAQLAGLRNRHTWVMSLLYIGTFGSFIGFSFALPLLTRTSFPEVSGWWLAASGPLIGSLTRPLGGWLADWLGGARVTAYLFMVLGIGTLGVIWGLQIHSFALYLGAFLLLFAASGAGNGSTYRMIPAIWRAEAIRRAGEATDDALLRAKQEAATVIGLTSAIGALGGFGINRAFAESLSATGSATAALLSFVACYAICLLVTWWFYLRRRVLVTVAPSLATANV